MTNFTLMMVVGALALLPLGAMAGAYASTENLFVSAENDEFDNSFAGPMVIEIMVNDPDLEDVDQAEGEPDVTVNGATLTMVQASDGNWYAYIAERDMAIAADAQSQVNGTGLDFGVGCTVASLDEITSLGGRYSDTDGVYFNAATDGTIVGGLGDCTEITSVIDGQEANTRNINVVREAKNPSGGGVALSRSGSLDW